MYSSLVPKPKDRAYSLASSKVQTVFFAESSDGVRVRFVVGSNAHAAATHRAATTRRAIGAERVLSLAFWFVCLTTAIMVASTRRDGSNATNAHVCTPDTLVHEHQSSLQS